MLGVKLNRPPQRKGANEDAAALDSAPRRVRHLVLPHAPRPPPVPPQPATNETEPEAPSLLQRRQHTRRLQRLLKQRHARLAALRTQRRVAPPPQQHAQPFTAGELRQPWPHTQPTGAGAAGDRLAGHHPGAHEAACRQRLAALGDDWGAWLAFLQHEGPCLGAINLEDACVRLRMAYVGSATQAQAAPRSSRGSRLSEQRSSSQQQQQQQHQQQHQQQGAGSCVSDPLTAAWTRLVSLTQSMGAQLQPQQWGNVAYTAVKLGRCQPALLAAVEAHTLAGLGSMRGPALANTAWAFAVAGTAPSGAWMEAWCSGVDAQLPYLNVHQVATCLWTLGRLRHRAPGAFLQRLLTWLANGMGTLAPTELSNAAWALSQLRFRPSRRWLLRWCWFSGQAMREDRASPALLAGMLASMAVLRHAPTPQWRYEWRRSLGRQLGAATGRQLSLALCAAAKLRWPLSPHWVHAYGRALQQVLHRCTPSDLAAAAWALPRVAYPYPGRTGVELAPLLAQLADRMEPQLHLCTPAQLVQVAVGFAGLGFDPGVHWMKVHENACAARVGAIDERNRERLRLAYLRIWGVR